MQPSLTTPPPRGDETANPLATAQPPLSPELPEREPDPAPPPTETPPKDTAKAGGILLPKGLVDDLYREARKNFVLIPDMTFALAAGSRALRDLWEHKDGKFIRKEKPFANYIRPKDGDENTPPTPTPKFESPTVAEARAKWDEAKREGDPDRMTRTANDLLRAVEADQRDRKGIEDRRQVNDILAPEPPSPNHVAALGMSLGGGAASTAMDRPVQDENSKVEDRTFEGAAAAPIFEFALPDIDEDVREPDEQVQAVAWVTPTGKVTGLIVDRIGSQSWTPQQRSAAQMIEARVQEVGKAIQKYGTPDQKQAWKQMSKLILQTAPTGTGGSAEYHEGSLRVDLTKMGRPADANDPAKQQLPPDPDYVTFMLVHEFFHATESNQRALYAAFKMQGEVWQEKTPTIGSPQWSVEVRHDKMVYDFLLKSGLLPSPPPPIERIAPYYAEHLRNPSVPVHKFPVPGYDKPID